MEVVEQLKENGTVVRGWLGVGIQKVDMDLAKSFGLDRPSGALVTEVFPGSAAEKGGVMAGDIISSFNGKKVDLSDNLPRSQYIFLFSSRGKYSDGINLVYLTERL